MIDRIKTWFDNEFFRNVVVLFSGSAVAQAIPLLSMLILTRMYPEEAFGVFFVYAAAGVVLAILSTLKYELSVVLPHSDNAGFSLLILSLFIAFLVTVAGELIIILLFDHIQAVLAEKSIGKWLYFLPLSMFFTGIMQAVGFWFNRFKQYRLISTSRIVKAVVMSAFQIAGGVVGLHTTGLITGLIIGQGAAAIYVLILIFPEIKKHKESISIKKMIEEGKKYLNIPLFNTLMGLLNSISNQLPVFLLSRFFGAKIVAYYGLANRVISVPVGLVTQSVGQVFYQDAAQIINNKGDLLLLVRSLYKQLLKFGFIPFLVLLLAGPWLFNLLFGLDWRISGVYTQILSPWLLLMFLNSPLSYIITILNKQKQMLIYQSLLLLFRFLALFFGYNYFNSALIAVILFSAVGIVFNLLFMQYIFFIARQFKSGIAKSQK